MPARYRPDVRVLVTGGNGFVGRALVARLASMEHEVTVLDDLSRSDPRATPPSGVRTIRGDVRDAVVVRNAVGDADLVVHLAAVQGTGSFYRIPFDVLDVNVNGTFNVVRACVERRVKRLFFSSSSEIYGLPARFPTPEGEPASVPDVLNPRYSYGGSKIAGELMVVSAARQHGLAYTIVRYHNVYGPAMGWDHVIPQFIERLETGTEFTVQGDGEQTRSFCYIDDAVEGSVLAMLSEAGRDRIFNIGDPSQEHSINDLIRMLETVSGKRVEPRYVPFEQEGTKRRVPDITLSRTLLGFHPAVTLRTGLDRTYRWYAEAIRSGARPQGTFSR